MVDSIAREIAGDREAADFVNSLRDRGTDRARSAGNEHDLAVETIHDPQ
jgi:hypothetical protein